MSRWMDAFETHAFQNTWEEVKSALADSEVDDETIVTSVLELSRLVKVVKFIDELLDNIDPELVPLSTWDAFQGQATPCRDQINGFNSNRNIQHLVNANVHADNLITYVRPYTVAVSKAGRAMQSALRSYSENVEQYLESFRKKGSEILGSIEENKTESENSVSSINTIKQSIRDFESELFESEDDEEGLADKIRTLHSESDDMHTKINDFHNELLVSDEEASSIKQQVVEAKESIVGTSNEAKSEADSMKEKIAKLNKFYIKIFGKIVKDTETNEESVSGGLENEIGARVRELESFETQQILKYNALTDQIEGLIPGATSAGLASAYKEMKDSFEDKIKNASLLFYASIAALVLTSFVTVTSDIGLWYINFISVTDLSELVAAIVNKLPLYGPVLWLAFYATRRRSQNLRLQQEYAHKEALAKSYDSYRKQLQELGDEDGEMQKAFIMKAIDAISYNASETLDAKHSSDNPSSEIIKKLINSLDNG